ncbi:MAG: cell division protein FtsZ [Verrucomicrobiota bacterium]
MTGNIPDGGLRIKIVGVGGAGTNAVDRIKLEDLEQVHLAAIDTDSQTLASSPVEECLLIGREVTLGKSTGGSAEKGRLAADGSRDRIRQLFEGIDLVFLLAGLGGGTGSGAGPAVADLAVKSGALVIAFTPLPFKREGNTRMERAKTALEALQKTCHAVITLPNDVVFKQVDPSATVMEAFAHADKWIKLGVHSIWSMLFSTGLMNVDFSTLQAALSEPGGKTLFGTGYGKGESLVHAALEDLDRCPLLHLPESAFLKDTDQLIVNISGGPDLTMAMVDQVMDAISEKFNCRNSLVMGASINGSFYNQLRVTVMGTVRRVPSSKQFAPVPAASIAPNAPKPLPPTAGPVQTCLLDDSPQAAVQREGGQQDEFSFPNPESDRGFFDKSRRNLHEGIDLDIPTFVRRGIKIQRR